MTAVDGLMFSCVFCSTEWLSVRRLWRVLLWSQHPACTGKTFSRVSTASAQMVVMEVPTLVSKSPLMLACMLPRPRSTTWRWTWQHLGSGATCVSVRCFWSPGPRWCPSLLLLTAVKSSSRYFLRPPGRLFRMCAASSSITLVFIVRRDRFPRKRLLRQWVTQWKACQLPWRRRMARSRRRMSLNPEVR